MATKLTVLNDECVASELLGFEFITPDVTSVPEKDIDSINVEDFAFSDLSYYRYMLDLYANKGFKGISDEDLRFYTSKVLEASK